MYQSFINSLIVFVVAVLPHLVFSQPTKDKQVTGVLSPENIDALVHKTMKKFHVPGMAIGIIKDNNIVFSKGFGVRNIHNKEKVNTETLFSIASTGKSFTTASLALLVDAKKIHWDDKVIDYIPEFRLFDPWVTQEFTIRDLLVHNSGLGLGAGDLMVWPTPQFSRKEIIANLRYLKPVSSFRTQYAYDNLMYLVAGEVISTVSGISYEDFVEKFIFKPLNMKHCAANLKHLKGKQNIADPHVFMNGKLETVSRDVRPGEVYVAAAAGGIQCSVESILKWHRMFLNGGRFNNSQVFLSEEQVSKIMSPYTIMPINKRSKESFNTNFQAYGLGWVLMDMNGFKVEAHSGGLMGMLSLNLMVPDLNLGIIIYTNQQAGVARAAIMNTLFDGYTSHVKRDWIKILNESKKNRLANAKNSAPDKNKINKFPVKSLSRYTGIFEDPWFGKIKISEQKGELIFKTIKSSRLVGKMEPFNSDLFIVHWYERALNADAYVKYSSDYDGKLTNITMKAVSPLTDFSFDFHDLSFKRVRKNLNKTLVK